jgi:hypothetical protein
VSGPNSRAVSNRLFNDSHQNVFSERGVTQWASRGGSSSTTPSACARAGRRAGENANIPLNTADPMEEFTNDLGVIPFSRSNAAQGTGVDNPRQQVNTVSSCIDAFAVYGGAETRLDWPRQGPVDGNVTNNDATLLLPGGYLPRRDARGNAATAPADGRLRAQPNRAAASGRASRATCRR